ncbi:hypothetical protein ACI2L1_23335 [Streptomyces sp. NPDC019531]|uniref:hypothetical protein n=1 Tax=Streptomyces sp. NPDC019531 TaxID=3365062 RepID=UPI00384DB101
MARVLSTAATFYEKSGNQRPAYDAWLQAAKCYDAADAEQDAARARKSAEAVRGDSQAI